MPPVDRKPDMVETAEKGRMLQLDRRPPFCDECAWAAAKSSCAYGQDRPLLRFQCIDEVAGGSRASTLCPADSRRIAKPVSVEEFSGVAVAGTLSL